MTWENTNCPECIPYAPKSRDPLQIVSTFEIFHSPIRPQLTYFQWLFDWTALVTAPGYIPALGAERAQARLSHAGTFDPM